MLLARFIRILYELLTEKIDDVEIVTQTVYALFKMLLHKETREAISLHPSECAMCGARLQYMHAGAL